MKHERETPTAVGERLTRKELGRESEDLDSDRRHSYRVYNPVRIAIVNRRLLSLVGLIGSDGDESLPLPKGEHGDLIDAILTVPMQLAEKKSFHPD